MRDADGDLDYDAFLDAVADGGTVVEAPPLEAPGRDDADDLAPDADLLPPSEEPAVPGGFAAEFVVRANGTVQQAGADSADSQFIAAIRQRAERSLYTFAKVVLGRAYLTKALHLPVCAWLQRLGTVGVNEAGERVVTAGYRRKGLLLPREHAKSSLVSHALPIHILVQPKDANVYFPGEAGVEQRITLACVTADLAKKHTNVQRRVLERNALLRAFWPHVVWENPKREAPVWRDDRYVVPREGDWPDPSVQAIGVDGAITGAHPSVLVKDDLIEVEAANSPVVMQTAIEWHRASRSLVNKPECLEFVIGTRWAVHDLYSEIQEHDPTVEWHIRAAVEDGKVIYPEGGFSHMKLAELQADQGGLFLLLYMNSAADPSLTDFDLSQLRHYRVDQGVFVLDDDPRDAVLREMADPVARAIRAGQAVDQSGRGRSVADWLASLGERDRRRHEHLRTGVRVVAS